MRDFVKKTDFAYPPLGGAQGLYKSTNYYRTMKLLRTFILFTAVFGLMRARAETTYWLPAFEATLTEKSYRYGIQLPDKLGKELAANGTSISHTVDGKAHKFVDVTVDWDSNSPHAKPAGGQMSINKANGYGQNWLPSSPELAKNTELVKALEAVGVTKPNGWVLAELLILVAEGTENPNLTLRLPISEQDQIKARMLKLAESKVPGQFFPNEVQIPADLDAMRREMLALGNIGRRDPQFRKANKWANNLSGDTATGPKGPEKIFKNNPNPPYFNDLVLHPKLNEAAQYMAEYYAKTNGNARQPDGRKHDAPEAVWQGAKMDTLGDRLNHFAKGVGSSGEGLAGAGPANDAPEGWMHTETHYRPWFNIGHDTKSMGLGAAWTANGWYFCKIGGLDLPDGAVPGQAGTLPMAAAVLPLPAGSELKAGTKYRSPSGGHYLIFQPDGNLVVYTSADQHVWDIDSAAPKRKEAKAARMESDGNLVVRDAAGNHIWSALHKNPDASATLTISPTGALQLVSGKSGQVLWSSSGADPIPVVTSWPAKNLGQGSHFISGSVNWLGCKNQICDETGIIYAPTSANPDPLVGGKDVVNIKSSGGAVDGTKCNSAAGWGIPLSVYQKQITTDTEYTYKAYAVFGKETFYSPAQKFKTDK